MATKKTKGTLGFLGYGTGSFEPFDQAFQSGIHLVSGKVAHNEEGNKLVAKEMKEADALVIWGGEDISPTLYGEAPAYENGASEHLSRRDLDETRACLTAIEQGKPIIGVCRGAQLVCALAGGKLVQHVTGHGQSHNINTWDKQVMKTSSVHHQMMWPWAIPHRILAWCDPHRSDVYVFTPNHRLSKTVHIEPEVIWFPEIKALAIQGHPEFMAANDAFVQWCMEQVRELVHPEMKVTQEQ